MASISYPGAVRAAAQADQGALPCTCWRPLMMAKLLRRPAASGRKALWANAIQHLLIRRVRRLMAARGQFASNGGCSKEIDPARRLWDRHTVGLLQQPHAHILARLRDALTKHSYTTLYYSTWMGSPLCRSGGIARSPGSHCSPLRPSSFFPSDTFTATGTRTPPMPAICLPPSMMKARPGNPRTATQPVRFAGWRVSLVRLSYRNSFRSQFGRPSQNRIRQREICS